MESKDCIEQNKFKYKLFLLISFSNSLKKYRHIHEHALWKAVFLITIVRTFHMWKSVKTLFYQQFLKIKTSQEYMGLRTWIPRSAKHLILTFIVNRQKF